jgi:hypothetical protein
LSGLMDQLGRVMNSRAAWCPTRRCKARPQVSKART